MPKKHRLDIKHRKTITVSATEAQIKVIEKKLNPENLTIESLGSQMYLITTASIKILMPMAVEDIALGQLTGEDEEETVELMDFEGSDMFYTDATKRNNYKIISDEFSDMRNRELYKAFQLIEHRWRHNVSLWHSNHGKKLITNNGKLPDHAVATYGLAEFYEQFLYAPASEEYMRKEWDDTKKDADAVIRIANLKLLDELGIKLTVEELELIRETRNACMHSRVITPNEYREVTRLINRYLISEERKEFTQKIVASFGEMQKRLAESIFRATESIRPMQESLAHLAGPTFIFPKVNVPQVFNEKIKEMLQTGLKKTQSEDHNANPNN